jgi:DeoR family glycerol-3-phosphate regulon repressor
MDAAGRNLGTHPLDGRPPLTGCSLTEAYGLNDRSVKSRVGTVMTPEERRQEITRLAHAEGRVAVEELVARLNASRETMRRDLTVLAGRGILLKYHGGARTPRADIEGPFQARMAANMPAKRRIAAAAARLFEPGDTLFIDTGTTTLCLAEALGRLKGLTVVTNAPRLAGAIADLEGGIMDYDIDEAQVAQAMIGQAEQVTVVADASKLGRRALFQVCELAAVDRLVTDAAPPAAIAAALGEAGVAVVVADGP